MLGKGRQQMNHELIRVRIVRCDEVDAALHQPGNEMDASGEAVEFRNNQRCLGLLGGSNGSREWLSGGPYARAIRSTAAIHT
jgi:hypothetical protein